MVKKPARKTQTDRRVDAVERERLAEAARLRRMRALHDRIIALSRALTRAVRRADTVRAELVHDLITRSDQVVVERKDWTRLCDANQRLRSERQKPRDLESAVNTLADLAPPQSYADDTV